MRPVNLFSIQSWPWTPQDQSKSLYHSCHSFCGVCCDQNLFIFYWEFKWTFSSLCLWLILTNSPFFLRRWDFCFLKGRVIEHLDGHSDIVHKQFHKYWLPRYACYSFIAWNLHGLLKIHLNHSASHFNPSKIFYLV